MTFGLLMILEDLIRFVLGAQSALGDDRLRDPWQHLNR